MALLGGSGAAAMARDVGTAGSVQGFRASGSALHGARLVSALASTVRQQAGAGWAQLAQAAAAANKQWVRVSGVWKEATTWIRVGGVWKTATPKFNDGGTWR
jgi:hypothetical protein